MTRSFVDFMLRNGCEITKKAIEDAQPNPFIRRMRGGQSLDFGEAYEAAQGRTTLNSALRRIGYKLVKTGAAYTLINYKKDDHPVAYGSFAQVKSAIWEMIFGDDVGDDYDYLTDTDYDDDDDDD